MPTLHEFAPDTRRKANNDFQALEQGNCFATNEGSKRITREGDDTNVIFRLEGPPMFMISYSILFIQNSSKAQRVCRFIVLSVQFNVKAI